MEGAEGPLALHRAAGRQTIGCCDPLQPAHRVRGHLRVVAADIGQGRLQPAGFTRAKEKSHCLPSNSAVIGSMAKRGFHFDERAALPPPPPPPLLSLSPLSLSSLSLSRLCDGVTSAAAALSLALPLSPVQVWICKS